MDEDFYPEEHELEQIRKWPAEDIEGMMEFIHERWNFAAAGYWRETPDKWFLSTAGWSGNESIIDAMADNAVFWLMCWVSSRRGGHYEFDKKKGRIK